MKKVLSLLVAAVLVMGWSATSFAGKNFYASGNVGMAWFDDATATGVEGDEDDTVDLSFDSGIALTGAIGCDFGSTRLEAELGYQTNDVSTVTESDGKATNTEEGYGDVSLTTFMFNGYYDIKPMDDSDFEIFLTAGIGAAFVNVDEVGPQVYPSGGFDDDYSSTFSETTWAYQIGAGVGIPVGDGIMVDARYRYLSTADVTTRDDDDAFDNDPMNISFDSHSALVGLRYNF